MKKIKNKLNAAIKTGKVVLGSKKVLHTLLTGSPKMIILSRNCRKETRESIAYYTRLAGISSQTLDDDSVELGSVCGKPYPISAVAVVDPGDSDILG